MKNSLPLGLKVDPKSDAVVDLLGTLQAYDFSRIAWDCQQKFGWSEGHANAMLLECKQFLALAVLDPGHYHAPGHDADEFWHRAILNTQWYSTMCERVFGTFLHHSPLAAVEAPQIAYRDRTPQVLAYWFGADRYGPNYQLLGTCQQCNNPTNLAVRPHEAVVFGSGQY